MDTIKFDEFSTIGVLTSDTFNEWRLKTNGITEQLNVISPYVSNLHDGTNITYVTVNTAQAISGVKTFAPGTSTVPLLNVGSSGLYYEDSKLKITTGLQSNTLIAGTTLGLGANSYAVPVAPPAANAYLTSNSGTYALTWSSEESILARIQSAVTSFPVGVLNQIIPVGSISAYSGSVIPTGWLQCTGALISGSTYSDLCQVLKTTYGAVYNNAGGTGTPVAVKGGAYTWNAVTSLTHYFTLPNLYGRSIIGTGTGNDGSYNVPFTLGQTGGIYKKLLTTLEMPTHLHGVGTLATSSDGAHTHEYTARTITEPYAYLGSTLGFASGNTSAQTLSAGSHTHSITGNTASSGSSVPFDIIQPYLSTTYIIKAIADTVINTTVTSSDGIQFSKVGTGIASSFNIKDSGEYTIKVNHDSTLSISSGILGLADSAVTVTKITNASITPAKLASVSGGTISWDASYAYHKALPLATRAYVDSKSFRKGNVQQLREKAFGDTSAMSWQDYAYINDDENVVVTGINRYSIFGACNAYGNQIMPLPLNHKASKLYISEYAMACIDTLGQLWAMGRNTHNQFNILSGSAVDLITWTRAFPQITASITKVVLGTYNTYVLDSSDKLWAAGINTYGQLGNGTTVNTNSVPTLGYEDTYSKINITDIVICGSETYITACAKCTDNVIYTCGYGGYGQIGNGSVINKSSWTPIIKPVDVVNWSGYKLYNKGHLNFGGIIAINSGKTLAYAWGYNGDTSFGVGTTSTSILSPIKIWPTDIGIGTISKFYTTFQEGVIYVLTTDNKIFATGNNASGNFGNGGITSRVVWTELTIPTDYTLVDLYVSNSNSLNCSVIIKCTKDGNYFLFGAGDNSNGQLGNAQRALITNTFSPILISSEVVADIKDVQITYNYPNGSYTLLLLNDGELYWSGFNEYNFDSSMESSRNYNQVRTIFNRVK